MRIHFLNIKKVEKKLKDKGLSEREKFQYILAIATFFQLLTILAAYNGIHNFWEWAANILALVAIVLGTYYVYKKNGAGRGHDFLERFISLAWVCGVRVTLFIALPVILIWGTIVAIKYGQNAQEYLATGSWFDVVFVAVISAVFYWRIGEHIDRIRGKKK